MKAAEDRWAGADVMKAFDQFEAARSQVRRATQLLLHQFYHNEHFDDTATVLEVGAGKGELYRQWPHQFNGLWIQLDPEPELLKHAQGQKVSGSAYAIPLPNNSVDVVCGLGSYDVLFNLEDAVSEAWRVLKPSGWFFHLLDLKANDDAVFYDLERNGRLVLFDELVSTVIHAGKEEAYQKEIEEWFKLPFNERKGNRWDIAEKYGYNLDMTAYFTERLVSALKPHFGSVEAKPLLAYCTGQRQPHHEYDRKVYVNLSGDLRSYLGGPRYAHLPKEEDIPESQCLEVSEMQLVIARKPITEHAPSLIKISPASSP